MMRTLNLVFLAVLLAVVAVLGGGMHLVHDFQMQRNASALLDRARRAEAGNKLDKAEEALSQYLSIKHEDEPVWAWYARVLDLQDSEGRRRERVFLVHQQALRYNPGDLKLERRCADLAFELKRYNDAHRHLDILLEQLSRDSQSKSADQATAKEKAELEDLLGQCDRGLLKYDEAEKWFREALKHDPGRLACYDRLARMRRTELRRVEAADRTITEMVSKNPKLGRAYAYRWRYAREFLASADASDIQNALELAPDDSEVLLTAAVASEQKPDAAAERAHLDKGFKLDPKNAAFAIGLARLELREQHPDRAEAVLRQAYQARPSVDVAFRLAENLIIQGKIEGKDQAAGYMAYLRARGLGDTRVRYLEARILFQQQKWAETIPKLEMARAVLKSDSGLTAPLNLMLADCYKRLGSDEQRLDALRQVAESEQSSESVRLELARALAQSGKLDQALAILSRLAERQPELKLDIARLMIRKTLGLPQDQRRWQEVEQRLHEAEKALPGGVEDLTAIRADLLGFQGKPGSAKEVLEQAIQHDPKSVRSRIALAVWLQGRNDVQQAEKVLDRAEKDLGATPGLLRARVGFWSRRGGDEAKKAVNQLAESRHQIPAVDLPAFLDELATAFYRLGDPVRAGQLWGELSQLQPENLEILSRRGDLAIAARDRPAVEEVVGLIKRIEGDQGTHWRYFETAWLIGEAGRGDATTTKAARTKASNLVEEILARRGDWWGGLVLRGQLAELTGQPEDAVRDYLQAIDRGAMQPDLARRLVGLLYQRQQFDKIDQIVQKLIERGMAPDDLKLVTALDALRKNEIDRGLALAREVVSESSTNAFDLLFLGRMLLYAGRPAEAEQPLRRALDLAPAVADAWLSYVQYQVRSKVPADRIRQTIRNAAQKLPVDRAALTLAQCFELVGDKAEAAKQYQDALAAQPASPATLRLAAGFFARNGETAKVWPLLDRLLDPRTGAGAADIAWANRTRGLAQIQTGGNLEDIERAISLIDQNLKANPYALEDQVQKAIFLAMRTSKRQEAILVLEKLDKTGSLTPNEAFLLAMLYGGNRDWSRSQALMLRIVANPNREPRHLAYLVSLLIDQRALEPAEHWLAELKPLAAQSPVVLDLQARLLKAQKREADLVALLRSYSQDRPDQIGAVAVLYDRYGYLKDAEEAYRAFVSRGGTKEPWRVLALIGFLGRRHRAKEALDLCEPAWKTCPPEAVGNEGVSVLSTARNLIDTEGRRLDARLTDAVKQHPGSALLRTRLATLRNLQNRNAEAEVLYREALAINPNDVESLNNLAWQLAFQDGKGQEALSLVNRAIETADANSFLLDTRAAVHLQIGRADLALHDLQDAVRDRPDSPNLQLHLAWAHQMAKNAVAARAAFRQAEQLGLNPETMNSQEREIFLKLRQELAVR